MSGVLVRLCAVVFAGGFGACALYSAARNRRIEAGLYAVATASVFVMVGAR